MKINGAKIPVRPRGRDSVIHHVIIHTIVPNTICGAIARIDLDFVISAKFSQSGNRNNNHKKKRS